MTYNYSKRQTSETHLLQCIFTSAGVMIVFDRASNLYRNKIYHSSASHYIIISLLSFEISMNKAFSKKNHVIFSKAHSYILRRLRLKQMVILFDNLKTTLPLT